MEINELWMMSLYYFVKELKREHWSKMNKKTGWNKEDDRRDEKKEKEREDLQ